MNPKNMAFVGVFGSAIINILMSFSSELSILKILWGFNGWLQSLIWFPIVRILAEWLPDENRKRAGVSMQTTVIFGSLAAYLITSVALKFTGKWRTAFLFVGLVVLLFSIIW